MVRGSGVSAEEGTSWSEAVVAQWGPLRAGFGFLGQASGGWAENWWHFLLWGLWRW